MKILQLGKFYPIKGGIEKVMFDIMKGLAARGVHCDMMCTSLQGRGKISRVAYKARLLTFRTWIKASSTTISPSLIPSLKKIAPRYDIIHIHHPDPMAALALYLSGYKGKVILHWHSDIVRQKKLVTLYKPLQDWLINRADTIIGTTEDYIKSSPFLKNVQHKTVCVPIGIEPISPDVEGAAGIRNLYPGKKIVYFMGRLIGYKGLEYLVEAAKYLPDDYVILIGGEGPCKDELETEIQQLEVAHKVKLTGKVDQDKVAAYYTACDVFCLPSIMPSEAFGIVQIEAMSLGKPVVATNIKGSGTAWVNKHGFSGLNVPVCDARALADAITDITSDPERYARFCSNARHRFDTFFEIETMIDKIIDNYNNLLH